MKLAVSFKVNSRVGHGTENTEEILLAKIAPAKTVNVRPASTSLYNINIHRLASYGAFTVLSCRSVGPEITPKNSSTVSIPTLKICQRIVCAWCDFGVHYVYSHEFLTGNLAG